MKDRSVDFMVVFENVLCIMRTSKNQSQFNKLYDGQDHERFLSRRVISFSLH